MNNTPLITVPEWFSPVAKFLTGNLGKAPSNLRIKDFEPYVSDEDKRCEWGIPEGITRQHLNVFLSEWKKTVKPISMDTRIERLKDFLTDIYEEIPVDIQAVLDILGIEVSTEDSEQCKQEDS